MKAHSVPFSRKLLVAPVLGVLVIIALLAAAAQFNIAQSILPALSFDSISSVLTSGGSVKEIVPPSSNKAPESSALAASTGEGASSATSKAAASSAPPVPKTAFDFDGDQKADLAVWQPSDGVWSIRHSSTQSSVTQQWGAAGDRIVPADYDNDGRTDYAVWTPSSGMWSIRKSSNGQTLAQQWGASTDIPVPGDYDGDGNADIAVWRPSNGVWYIVKSSGGTVGMQLGSPDDVPVPGDYDGDGKTDVAVRLSTDGRWYIWRSSDNQVIEFSWGFPTDTAIPADYDGDGKTDLAVWRASAGNPPPAANWYIYNSQTGSVPNVQFGASSPADVMAPADYDGDGKADVAVWRPSNGYWYIWRSSDSALWESQLGVAGDVPVPAVFIKQTIPAPTPTPTPTPTPPPSGALQLSKEYIYAGSRMLAVEEGGN